MTLLERFDNGDFDRWTDEAVATVRRALAVAQAVDEANGADSVWWVKCRADEMLEGK